MKLGTITRSLYSFTMLFALAGDGALRAQVPAQFMPTRFTVVDQGTVGKPDIVLIPGLNSSRAVWEKEAPKLAPNYSVHLVQINGFAGQPAGDNAGDTNLIQSLVVELDRYISTRQMQPVVIGHSLGGLLALLLAEQHPADVHKLIIVDTLPFYGTMFTADASAEGGRPIAAQMKRQIMSVPEDQYNAMQPAIAAQMVHDLSQQKLIAEWSSTSNRSVTAEAMSEDLTTDGRPALREVKMAVLVLFEHDQTLMQPPADAYEKLMRAQWSAVPNATVTRIDNSRHFIMYDQPEKFHAEITAFLTKEQEN